MTAPLPSFKIGDVVEATAPIWRYDNRSMLRTGERAKVWRVWPSPPERARVIDLKLGEDKHPIGDLVVSESLPLRLVEP